MTKKIRSDILIIYTVKKDDTLYTVARNFNTSVDKLMHDNQLENPLKLVPGQALVIPSTQNCHKIQRGDTLHKIANRYNLTISELLQRNPFIEDSAQIYPGQTICVPEHKIRRSIDVNGFSVKIPHSTLSETLPFLTYFSQAAYHVDANGKLNPPKIPTDANTLKEGRVAPLMCVANMTEGGMFSSDIAHAILTSQPAQDAFMENVQEALKSGNYYGLIVNFEYIYPFDRVSYNQFMRKISEILHSLGYLLATAVAPKTSADQPGTLYEAHDYPALGEICDLVIVMTYEWGHTHGPAMAVSPIGPIKKVLDYSTSAIPSKKKV